MRLVWSLCLLLPLTLSCGANARSAGGTAFVKPLLGPSWRRGRPTRRVMPADVQDVEDESSYVPLETMIQPPREPAPAPSTVYEASKRRPLPEDIEFSSRTLRALKDAEVEGKALLTKATQSLKAFSAYAASRAAADSELLLRVGVVAASELVAYITKPLLPSSSSQDSASRGYGTLSLKEKMELVALGIFPVDLSPRKFMVSSFSSAGDDSALLADMTLRDRRQRGPTFSRLPKPLSVLRAPLRFLASVPMLPLQAVKAADAAYGVSQEASQRQPTKHIINTISKPVIPLLGMSVALSRGLVARSKSGSASTSARLPAAGGYSNDDATVISKQAEKEGAVIQTLEVQQGSGLSDGGVVPSSSGDGVLKEEGRGEEGPTNVLSTSAAVNAEEKVVQVSKMSKAEPRRRQPEYAERSRSATYDLVSSGAGSGAMVLAAYGGGGGGAAAAAAGWYPVELMNGGDDVIETAAYVSVDDGDVGTKGDAVLTGVVKVLDFVLVALEMMAFRVVPVVWNGAALAAQRAAQALGEARGGEGVQGWVLMPAFRGARATERSLERR